MVCHVSSLLRKCSRVLFFSSITFLLIVAVPGDGLGDTSLGTDFNDPTKCAACHREIFEQWEGSMHSLAAKDKIFRKFYEMVVREVGEPAVAFCMKCHSPVGVYRKQVPPATGENLDAVAMRGVFCDFCHTVTPTGIGNAAFETTFSETKRGPFDDAKSPVHLTKTEEIYSRSEFCGMCHNVTHPLNGRHIERTYLEWKESPYNTGDPDTSTHCQDCHMRQYPGNPGTGATEKKDSPGKAAIMGPERPHIWTHYFVGANALYPESPNWERRKKMVEERLSHAAKLEIVLDESPGETGNIGKFRVRVHNVGAGHKLPTGLSEVREMWLEVRVTDGEGSLLLESGTIGKGGGIDPGAAIFKTFLGIGKDNVKLSCCFFAIVEANKILSAERVTRDRRIIPKGYDEERYAFAVPEGVQYPIAIHVRLNYRSMSQAFANIFFPDGSLKVPVILMAEQELSLPGKE